MKTIPSPLQKGDVVAIVATARKISKEEIEPALKTLNKWGLQAVLAPDLFDEENQFAGSDAHRAANFQWAIDNELVKAVFVARGGYGTLRIIDKIDFSKFSKAPKWICGYSDVTVLHSHLSSLGFASIHGTMPINFSQSAEATESLRKALFAENISYETLPHPLNRPGESEGELIGGNLSLLYALSGSVSDIDTENKILFIEDLDEYLYHIDRMMLQLKRSGKLKNLKGLIVGGMTEMKDNKIPFGKTAEEIISEAVSEYSYPVCFNFPAGHIERNLALYIGKDVRLSVNQTKSTLNYL